MHAGESTPLRAVNASVCNVGVLGTIENLSAHVVLLGVIVAVVEEEIACDRNTNDTDRSLHWKH